MNLIKLWKQITSLEYTVALWSRMKRTEKSVDTLRDLLVLHDKELGSIKKLLFRHQELMKTLPSLSGLNLLNQMIEEKKLDLRVLDEQHEALRQDIRLHTMKEEKDEQEPSPVNPGV